METLIKWKESYNFVAVRYFIDISYRGTNYSGWQTQPNGVTVQEEIEKAISTILQIETAITGSGRTDAGVHATQQIAHFDADNNEPKNLVFKLNSFLDPDISVNGIRQVKDDVSARFEATSRKYHYHLHQAKDPFKTGLSYYFRPQLDIDLINKGCEIIKGWQNFECFSKVHTEVNHFNCDIFQARWVQDGTNHLFEITANRFLRGMVRAIVGTLIDVGLGKTSLEGLKNILESNDRSEAGRAVPPEGLYLQEVTYPEDIYIN
ncbi:tRNA pseudouridine(38-40) synthase TruA [Ekhidna sp. MALMAid0563]|uniref:tRNA pseudouridine(38-40) synthase TruA n=1 Tax=Ekhidna sp. MALMAid0563 TaxID=3143937 RepID=UPI0032DFC30B